MYKVQFQKQGQIARLSAFQTVTFGKFVTSIAPDSLSPQNNLSCQGPSHGLSLAPLPFVEAKGAFSCLIKLRLR